MNVETNKPDREQNKFNRGNNRNAGIVIILIGIIILLNKIPFTAGFFPFWFFSWPMLLVGIGIFSGVRSGFRGPSWIIVTLLGCYFLLHYNNFISVNLKPYLFPIGVIVAGIFMLTNRKNNMHCKTKAQNRLNAETSTDYETGQTTYDAKGEDIINTNALFGSIERTVFSKDFKRGNVSSVFAGVQLNFVQADIKETAFLDITVAFGGLEIIVPANWVVKSEIPAIFGGVEDKRRFVPNNESTYEKTLILRGTVIFGGIEIKSY